MKPQDALFVVLLVGLFFRRSPLLFALAGLLFVLLAIPLFATWVFFTAERLVWYAAAFFLIAIALFLKRQ